MDDLFSTFAEALNPTGAELKELGMQQAIKHADEIVESWSDKAFKHFAAYCQTVDELKTEDARMYAEAQGLEEPPTKRAWGAVAQRVAKAGIIFKKGVVTATNPKCHMGFTTVWGVVK